ncbi:hypothetical protein B0H13DRAFT_1875478 [Mycena leptocephala]|nr:hypothetical protein B0H13DRAFT_1875478 [Mycena leptocephala]
MDMDILDPQVLWQSSAKDPPLGLGGGGGGILYSRGPQAEQRVYGRQTSSTVRVVILTDIYQMPTEHNIILGGRTYKTLANCELAGGWNGWISEPDGLRENMQLVQKIQEILLGQWDRSRIHRERKGKLSISAWPIAPVGPWPNVPVDRSTRDDSTSTLPNKCGDIRVANSRFCMANGSSSTQRKESPRPSHSEITGNHGVGPDGPCASKGPNIRMAKSLQWNPSAPVVSVGQSLRWSRQVGGSASPTAPVVSVGPKVIRGMALYRCRERIAKPILSGDSRKWRIWARWSVRTKTPAHRMSSVAKAGQHRARPGKVRFRKKRRHNVQLDIFFLRQGMASPRKDTSRIDVLDAALSPRIQKWPGFEDFQKVSP